jgi:hypothetical protein
MPTLDEQLAAIAQRVETLESQYAQTGEEEQEPEQPQRPTRKIERSETWKLRKPHPYWRPELLDEQRESAWLELSQDDRIYLSDNLGRRN